MLSRAATNRRCNLRLDGQRQRCIRRALKRRANRREIIGLFFFHRDVDRNCRYVRRIAECRDESRVDPQRTANCLIKSVIIEKR